MARELPPLGVEVDAPTQPVVADLPPLGAEVDAPSEIDPRQAEEAKDNQLRALFEAGLSRAPDAHAGVLAITKETGVPSDLVEQRYEEFRRTAEAVRFDPRRFRTENPALTKLLLERPETGPLVFKEEGLLRRFIGAIRQWDVQHPLLSIYAPPQLSAGELMDLGDEAYGGHGTKAERTFQLPEAKKVVATLDPSAQLTGLSRWVGTGPQPGIFQAAYQANQKQVEHSKLGAELVYRRTRGLDTWDLEKKIVDLRSELVPRDYSAGSVEQVLLDAVELLPSQVESLKGTVGGQIAGAAVGAVAGATITRSAAGARAGVRIGRRFGGKAGTFGSTFRLEMGSAYLDIREVKTDDGAPVDDTVAIGASVAYGLAAAAIETEAMEHFVRMFGPLGDAAMKGNGKAFLKSMLADVGGRKLLADVGKRWAKGVAGEAGEEGLQNLLQDVAGYFAKVTTAGKLQKADVAGSVADAAEVMLKTARGTGAIGAVGAVVNVAPHVLRRDASAEGARQVQVIAGLKDSLTARAAPEMVAKLIEEETASSGSPVTSMYVDAGAFFRLFQEQTADPDAAARELMGEEGPRKLKEAAATGQKIEIPLAEYLEKWAPKGISQALAADTAVRPGHMTARELAENKQQIQTEAQQLAQQYLADPENTKPTSQAEQRLVDAVEHQLARTEAYKPKDARQAVAITRAFLRTQAQSFNVDPDELFSNYVTRVERETGPAPKVALAQSDPELASATTGILEGFRAKEPEQRARDLYIDPGTGLLNERAFRALPAGPGSPAVAKVGGDFAVKLVTGETAHVSAEGVKFVNDTFSHTAGDALYQAAARALQESLEAHPDADLKTLLERANAAMPVPGFQLTGAVGKTFEAAGESHRALKDELEASGKRAPRGGRPAGFAGETAPSFPGKAVENLAIPESLKQAIASMPEEQLFNETYTEPSGLLNRSGFFAAPRKAHVASIDLKDFKKINDRFGRAFGDRVLRRFGEEAAATGANEFDFAHLSGDEYAAQSDDPVALQAYLDALNSVWENVRLKAPDGSAVEIGFRYGLGNTYEAADEASNARKSEGPEVERSARRQRALDRGRADLPEGRSGVREPAGGGVGRSATRGLPQGLRRREEAAQPGQVGEPASLKTPFFHGGEKASTRRGYVDFLHEGFQRVARIVLTPDANLSTFLHESGHVFLEMTADLVERPDAPERLKQDWATTLKWLGVEGRGQIGREHHEKWARAFEAYLLEGKAPSAALVRPFARFKLWLKEIYRSVAALNVELNDEIRGIFDRLLASDQEIERAKARMGLKPMFRSPEEAGMTPEQWQSYLDEQERATAHAARAAEARVLKDRLRETESWWKEELTRTEAASSEEFDRRPDVRARRYVVAGELELEDGQKIADSEFGKLNRTEVEQLIGKAEAKKRFRGRLAEDGEAPNDVAERFGFPSGRALLDALAAIPDRKQWAHQRAEEQLRERYPDILEERRQLADLVDRALHDELTLHFLLHEWQVLRQRAAPGAGGVPVESVKAAARTIVQQQQVRGLAPRRALDAERAAAEKAAIAAAKGDFAQAYVYKQQQLLNHYLFQELTRARERRDSFEKLAERMASQVRRATMGKVDDVYLGVSDQILQALGLQEANPATAALAGVPELMKAFEEDEVIPAFEPARLSAIVARPPPGGWQDLKVEDLEVVATALRQVYTAARQRVTVLVGERRVALAGLAAAIREEASRLPAKPPPAQSKTQETFKQSKVWTTGQHFLAAARDPLTTWLDDEYLGKSAREALRDRYYAQRKVEHELLSEAGRKFVEAFDEMPEEMKAHRFDVVDRSMLPEHEDQIRKGAVDRMWMYQLLANMGNAGNRERTLAGRGWTLEQVLRFFEVNKLTRQEAFFIQGLWDLNDKHLWPRLAAVHKNVNGLEPGKVDATPLTLQLASGSAVTLRGGYWPAMGDPKESPVGRKQEDASTASDMNYETFRASLMKGFTRERTEGARYVVRLDDFGAYLAHVQRVIRYIAYEEYVRDANRLLLAIKPVIDERLGAAAWVQLDRWLKVVASGSPDSIAAAERGLWGVIGFAVGRTVQTAMLFNLKNALADLGTPLLSIFGPKGARVRADYALGAMLEGAAGLLAPSRIGRGFWKMRQEAVAKSPELQIRHDRAVHQMRKAFDRIAAGGMRWQPFAPLGSNIEPGRVLDWLSDHGFVFQEAAAVWGETVAWEGAYRQGIAKGLGETEAIRLADDIIQKTFPSELPAEKSHAVRSKGAFGALLIMQGFFNRAGNRVMQTAHPALVEWAAAEGWIEKGKVAAIHTSTTGVMILGILATVGVLGSLLEGRGPEDDEEVPDWIRRKMAATPAQLIPLVSEAASLAELAAAGSGAKVTASERSAPVVSATLRLLRNLGAVADSDKADDKRLWATYEATAFALGLPVSQVKRTATAIPDVLEGSAGLAELIYGPSR